MHIYCGLPVVSSLSVCAYFCVYVGKFILIWACLSVHYSVFILANACSGMCVVACV